MHRNRTWITDYSELRTQRNHVLDIQGGDSNTKSINFLNESQNAGSLLNNGFLFARTNAGTYTNKLGIITTAAAEEPRFDYEIVSSKTNFVKYSQAFTNAYWDSSTTNFLNALDSVTTNPNGFTVNASSLTEKIYEVLTVPTATPRHIHQATGDFTPVVGTTYTMSCFVKQPTSGTVARYVQLALWSAGFGANAYMNFDLQAGTVGTGGAAITASSIQPAGNGWYRISATAPATVAASIGGFQLGIVTSSSAVRTESYIATAPFRVLFAWGAQFEESSAPTTYIPTTTAFVRVNYTRPLGLLLESQVRQFCSYTEDQSNAAWILYNGGSKDNKSTTIAPDGSANGNKLSHTTATEGGIYQVLPSGILNLGIGTTVTASVWVWTESGTASVRINYYSGADNFGTLETVTTTPRRITRTFTLLSTDVNSNVTISMNNTQACVWWGYQIETSKIATSYQPRTTGLVQRGADSLTASQNQNFSSWFGKDGRQGTLLANYTVQPVATSGESTVLAIGGPNSVLGFPQIYLNVNASLNTTSVVSLDVSQNSIANLGSNLAYTPGLNMVTAVSWNDKTTLLCLNGDPVRSETGVTYSYPQTGFGALYLNPIAAGVMYLKSFKYWVSPTPANELRQLVNNGLGGFSPSMGTVYLSGDSGFILNQNRLLDVWATPTGGYSDDIPIPSLTVVTNTNLKMRIIPYSSGSSPTMIYSDGSDITAYAGIEFNTTGWSNAVFGLQNGIAAGSSGRIEVYLSASPYTVVASIPYKYA